MEVSSSVSSSEPSAKKRKLCAKEDINLKYKFVIFDKIKNDRTIWKYFLTNDDVNDAAQCKLCSDKKKLVSTIGGSTSGMIAHLSSQTHKNDGKMSKNFNHITLPYIIYLF